MTSTHRYTISQRVWTTYKEVHLTASVMRLASRIRCNRIGLQLDAAKTEVLWCSSVSRMYQILISPITVGVTVLRMQLMLFVILYLRWLRLNDASPRRYACIELLRCIATNSSIGDETCSPVTRHGLVPNVSGLRKCDPCGSAQLAVESNYFSLCYTTPRDWHSRHRSTTT